MKRSALVRRNGGHGTLLTIILLAGAAAAARAQTVIVSNLADPAAPTPALYNTPADLLAQSFTPNSSVTSPISAEFRLALQEPGVSTSDTVHAYLYSDGAGTMLNGGFLNAHQPLSQVADLGTQAVTADAATDYTFDSSAYVTLTAGDMYWLVVRDDAHSNVGWYYTTSTNTTGSGSINATSTTGQSPNSGTDWLISAQSSGTQLFQVGTVTVILPEPGSLPLLIAGCPLLLLIRRRRSPERCRGTPHPAAETI